jgi:hypothetical protein
MKQRLMYFVHFTSKVTKSVHLWFCAH